MKHVPFVIVIAILILTACSQQTTPAPTMVVLQPETQTTMTSNPTQAPTEIANPTQKPTETNTIEQPTASEAVPTIFAIIPGESQVSCEVGETFFNENNRFATGVGVTNVVNGEIQVDFNNPQNSKIGTISGDISEFRSDSSRRDGALRDRFLQSAKYPFATFEPITITSLPTSYTAGEELNFQATGNLTVRETSLPVTFEVTAKATNDTVAGTATTTILFSEFGIGPITIAGILGTEDEAKLTFNFIAQQ